ncbi:MAG TPA: hypothetical protein VGC82_10525, partial [Rhodopila sp.]
RRHWRRTGRAGLVWRLRANQQDLIRGAVADASPRLAHPARLGDDVPQGHDKRGKTWSIW